jgi:hypothetical protein
MKTRTVFSASEAQKTRYANCRRMHILLLLGHHGCITIVTRYQLYITHLLLPIVSYRILYPLLLQTLVCWSLQHFLHLPLQLVSSPFKRIGSTLL